MPIGPTELLIVMFVFGAGKLPEVGSALGKSMKEFRGSFKDDAPPSREEPTRGEKG